MARGKSPSNELVDRIADFLLGFGASELLVEFRFPPFVDGTVGQPSLLFDDIVVAKGVSRGELEEWSRSDDDEDDDLISSIDNEIGIINDDEKPMGDAADKLVSS